MNTIEVDRPFQALVPGDVFRLNTGQRCVKLQRAFCQLQHPAANLADGRIFAVLPKFVMRWLPDESPRRTARAGQEVR